MRITHINSLYAPFQVGGAEKSVEILAEAQAALGHQVSVLCTTPEGDAWRECRKGVDVHYLPVRNLYRPFTGVTHGAIKKALWHSVDSWNPMMANLVRRYLRELRPEVVNTHTIVGFSAAVWGAVRGLGIPLAHTLRDYYLVCPRSTMFRDGHNCATPCGDCGVAAAIRRKQSAMVDAVVGNSSFTLDRHAALGYFPNAGFCRVIYGGQPAPSMISPRSPRDSRATVFGYIGQIQKVKGVDLLVDAFERLGSMVELRIAGRIDNDYARTLSVRSPKNVRWLGWTSPSDLFTQIDALVIPSIWHEPLPRAAIEAAMHGVPVIGSNRGGLPEIVEAIGGVSFNPDDLATLFEALEEIVRKPHKLRERSASASAALFDPSARATDYLTLYRAISDGRTANR